MDTKLVENKVFSFTVTGKAETNGAGECYILKDPFGYKHLLPASYYRHYGIGNGDVLNCRVDKINCDGNVFIEPEHPVYKEGNIYDFEFVRFVNILNEYGDKDLVAEVKDINNQIFHVLLKLGSVSVLNPPEKIKCRIEKIKKGRLYLSDPLTMHHDAEIKPGEKYKFKVVNTFISAENMQYFLLLDPFSRKHLLPQKYYTDYNITTGKNITCRVIKYSSKGFYLLEPEHPFYKEGNVYKFEVVENRKNSIIVKDVYTNRIEVARGDISDAEMPEPGELIYGMIEKFRKGRPVISLPEIK